MCATKKSKLKTQALFLLFLSNNVIKEVYWLNSNELKIENIL